MQNIIICYKRSLIGLNIVQTLYPCCLASRMQSVSFGKFRIVHTIIADIRVCTALHNYLLQSLIDMRSGNCENEWRSQPFVLLLLEKFMRMLHEYFRLLYFIY